MIIKPTPGRVVWYYPNDGDPSFSTGYTPPFAAHVAYVHSDRCVNLMVISPEGFPLQKHSVTLVQEGDWPPPAPDHPPPDRAYCTWMPYQKAVAKGETAPTLHATAGAPS